LAFTWRFWRLVGEMNNNFKQTEIGLIPRDWETPKILDYCDFIRGTEPESKSYNREKS